MIERENKFQVIGVAVIGVSMFMGIAFLSKHMAEKPVPSVQAVIAPVGLLKVTTYYWVWTCDAGHTLAPIFADKKLTIPSANPVFSNQSGSATFWVAAAKCYQIQAVPVNAVHISTGEVVEHGGGSPEDHLCTAEEGHACGQ